MFQQRSVTEVAVAAKEVAARSWRTNVPSVRARFMSKPTDWPKELRGILDQKRMWASPCEKSYLQSTSAWAWLTVSWLQGFHRQGKSMVAGFTARLYPEKHVLLR